MGILLCEKKRQSDENEKDSIDGTCNTYDGYEKFIHRISLKT
jgi:hypothetical protein